MRGWWTAGTIAALTALLVLPVACMLSAMVLGVLVLPVVAVRMILAERRARGTS